MFQNTLIILTWYAASIIFIYLNFPASMCLKWQVMTEQVPAHFVGHFRRSKVKN